MIRPQRWDESWCASLWQSFFATCVGAHIPALAELPLSACSCRKFTCDVLGDHVSNCAAHSAAKKAHDWAVEQLADILRTTHRVKTQQVAKSRGHRYGDIKLNDYLSNAAGPVSLVLLCWTCLLHMNGVEVPLDLVFMAIYITPLT